MNNCIRSKNKTQFNEGHIAWIESDYNKNKDLKKTYNSKNKAPS